MTSRISEAYDVVAAIKGPRYLEPLAVSSNSTRYGKPDYEYGTARFIEAVRAAEL